MHKEDTQVLVRALAPSVFDQMMGVADPWLSFTFYQAVQARLQPPIPSRPEWLYAVRQRVGGWVKIGWTQNPGSRMPALSASTPGGIEVIGFRRGTKTEEQEIHAAARPVHGKEWYEESEIAPLLASFTTSLADAKAATKAHRSDVQRAHRERREAEPAVREELKREWRAAGIAG